MERFNPNLIYGKFIKKGDKTMKWNKLQASVIFLKGLPENVYGEIEIKNGWFQSAKIKLCKFISIGEKTPKSK